MRHRKFIGYILSVIVTVISVVCILSVSVSAASGTIYESESNEDFDYADVTYDDYDNKGTITSLSDDDFWKITFDYSGYANFWLGNIPSGCNYELGVYTTNANGSLYVAGDSINTGNSDELITINVTANKTYYIYIFSIQGSSSSQYTFRAKVYPTKLLNVTLHEQQEYNTCSSACAYMTLKYHGVTGITEDDIYDYQVDEYGIQWNFMYSMINTINDYLRFNNKSQQYKCVYITSMSLTSYQNLVADSLWNNYLVCPLITVNATDYIIPKTDGHFIILNGLQYNPTTHKYLTRITDPFYHHSAIYNSIPLSEIYDLNMDHSGRVVMCGDY